MGLKDLFSSKRVIDKIQKYFQDSKTTLNHENNRYSFELFLSESGYSLYPYFMLNEDETVISIIINVRRRELNEDIYMKLNEFNLLSKYFQAKCNDDSIFLEYNSIISYDNIKEIFKKAIESIFSLQEEIDKL